MHPMMPLLMIFALDRKDKEKTNKTIQMALPSILPLPMMNRAVFATVLATQEVRREAAKVKDAEERLVQDTAKILTDKGNIKLGAAELVNYPNISVVLERRADLKAKVVV